MRTTLVLVTLVLVAAVVASRFTPKLERVEVVGNAHLSGDDVRRLADVEPGDPFLWVTSYRVRRLVADPWVRRVSIVRHWPSVVSITIWERAPALSDGATTWALDGTVLPGVLPNVAASLPRLTGWGSPRVGEALELLRLLHDKGPEVISYTPEGFEITLTGTTLFTSSPDALRQQWAAFESHLGGKVAVYPWGVSKSHE